ncbi:MAG: hypothetical protein LBS33_00095 [Streptococcaceae bacterium]|jgi:hypothetical protein|nr:hypothetical protein [Streptococcaceae bacterium]
MKRLSKKLEFISLAVLTLGAISPSYTVLADDKPVSYDIAGAEGGASVYVQADPQEIWALDFQVEVPEDIVLVRKPGQKQFKAQEKLNIRFTDYEAATNIQSYFQKGKMSQQDVIYGFHIGCALEIPAATKNLVLDESLKWKDESGAYLSGLSGKYGYSDGHPLYQKNWADTNEPDSRARGLLNALNKIGINVGIDDDVSYLDIVEGKFVDNVTAGQSTYKNLIIRGQTVSSAFNFGEFEPPYNIPKDDPLNNITAIGFQQLVDGGLRFGEDESYPSDLIGYDEKIYIGGLWHFNPKTAYAHDWLSKFNAFKEVIDPENKGEFVLEKPVNLWFDTSYFDFADVDNLGKENTYFQDYLNVFTTNDNAKYNTSPLTNFDPSSKEISSATPLFVANFQVMEMARDFNSINVGK